MKPPRVANASAAIAARGVSGTRRAIDASTDRANVADDALLDHQSHRRRVHDDRTFMRHERAAADDDRCDLARDLDSVARDHQPVEHERAARAAVNA